MKLATAVAQIQGESKFMGMSFDAVMKDIKKYGRLIYSAKTVEAFVVVQDARDLALESK